jgi:hypothetical protein
MNNPDHISESVETIFWGVKYLNSLMRIRDGKKIGSGINIWIRNTVRQYTVLGICDILVRIRRIFCILKVTEERSRIRRWIRTQNVTDPQH